MDSEADIAEKYRAFLERSLGRMDLRSDDDIFKMGVVNSLFAMQIVLFVESTFDMTIEQDDLELANFQTIEALARFVHVKQAARPIA